MRMKKMLAGILCFGCVISMGSPALAALPIVEDNPPTDQIVSAEELAQLEADLRRQEAYLAEQTKWRQVGPDEWEWVDPNHIDEPVPPQPESPCYSDPAPDAETGIQGRAVQVPCDGNFTSSAELVETPGDDEAPIAGLGVKVAQDFSLTYTAEKANVYAADLKTKLFTLAKGDSVLVKDESKKTLSQWTAVLVTDNGRDYLAYVRSSKLARKDKHTLRVRDLGKYSQYCMSLDADKSYKIYEKACSDSKQIGTLRKAIVLPVISVGTKFTAVRLYGGVGYIQNDCIALREG